MRKEGPAYDLPIALAILSAMGRLPGEAMEGMAAVGELSLSGSVMGVRGALSMAIAAKENGLRAIMLPASNAAEAACIEGLDILPVAHLSDAIAHLSGRKKIEPLRARPYASCWASGGWSATLRMCAGRRAPSARWKSRRRAATTC